jgi:hypothetical protein
VGQVAQVRGKSPAAQLGGFLARFTPAVAASAKASLVRMRKRLPGAIELVYDNYNALAIGFGPTERASDAVFSIAVFPRWVSLFFLQRGTQLPDPHRLLKGTGKQVRHIVLTSAADIDSPAVRALMTEALARADVPIDRAAKSRIVIKSVSAKQRPRIPRASGSRNRSSGRSLSCCHAAIVPTVLTTEDTEHTEIRSARCRHQRVTRRPASPADTPAPPQGGGV